MNISTLIDLLFTTTGESVPPVANAIGFSHTNIYQVRNGTIKSPSIDMVLNLLDYFHLDGSYLNIKSEAEAVRMITAAQERVSPDTKPPINLKEELSRILKPDKPLTEQQIKVIRAVADGLRPATLNALEIMLNETPNKQDALAKMVDAMSTLVIADFPDEGFAIRPILDDDEQ